MEKNLECLVDGNQVEPTSWNQSHLYCGYMYRMEVESTKQGGWSLGCSMEQAFPTTNNGKSLVLRRPAYT